MSSEEAPSSLINRALRAFSPRALAPPDGQGVPSSSDTPDRSSSPANTVADEVGEVEVDSDAADSNSSGGGIRGGSGNEPLAALLAATDEAGQPPVTAPTIANLGGNG